MTTLTTHPDHQDWPAPYTRRIYALPTLLLRCWLGLVAAVLGGLAQAQDKPVMTWLILDFPPAMILSNGVPVDGIWAQRLKMMMAEMPDMKHEFLVMSRSRLVASLKDPTSRACANNVIATPERAKQFYVSSTNLSHPISVIAKPAVLAKMAKNPQGEVLPSALFDRPDMVGVITPGRSYSALYDALLARDSAAPHIRTVTATRDGVNLLQMVDLGRVDYTLEYDFTVHHLIDTEPELKSAALEALPLAGQVLGPSGFMCPRNAWGFEAIKRIEGIVAKLLLNPAFQNLSNRWTSPKVTAALRPQADAFYKVRAREVNPNRFSPPP